MKIPGDGLIIIGENFNATRKIKITSPRVVRNSCDTQETKTDSFTANPPYFGSTMP